MKKSSKLSIIGITALLLFSCTNEESLIPLSYDDFKTIPVEEARSLVLEYAKKLYPETRSAIDITNSEVLPLTKDLLSVSTRAQSLSEIPDTSFYIFNFPGESGYAVASANTKYGRSLICLTEKGSLTSEDFSPIRTKATADSSGLEGGTGFIADLICASIMANEIAPPIDSTEIGGGPGFVIYNKYGPIVETKWDQLGTPFTDSTVAQSPAGCMAIAVGQTIVANQVSNTMSFNGKLCSWDDLASVCHYSNPNYRGTLDSRIQVANFLKIISDSDHCDINYGAEASSGTLEGAKRTLEAIGYSSATIHRHLLIDAFTEQDQSNVTNQVLQGKPVIMSASNGYEAHAWIVDGYLEAIANSNFYHINWGVNGLSDGYFWAGTFNQLSRFSRDEIDPYWSVPEPDNFDSQIQYLTYNF